MGIHSGVWVGPYNHQRYVTREINILHGAVELARRAMNCHATHFPKDTLNGRYLAKYSRPLYQLENAIDSWETWLLRLTTKEALKQLQILREKALDLLTVLGPAAEAFRLSRTTAWSQPKTVTPWRRVSATRMREARKMKKELMEARGMLREKVVMVRMYRELLEISNEKLLDLDVTKEVAQAHKERAQIYLERWGQAEERARLAEFQLETDTSRYEDQLSVASNRIAKISEENMRLQQQLDAANMMNLVQQFKMLKI
jgi:hypothetical protein